MKIHLRVVRQWPVSGKQAMNRRVIKPKEQMHYQHSLSAFFRLVGFAQAARPMAGCSPLAVLGRKQHHSIGAVTRKLSAEVSGSFQMERLRRPRCRGEHDPVRIRRLRLHPPLLQELQPPTNRAHAVKRKVRPNPSIERTSTGLARFTSLVYVPLRGPSRFWPAHVKR
jgi:hypothetical protein